MECQVTGLDGGSQERNGILLKFVDSGHVVGFDKRAIVARTCELSAAGSDVAIAGAVRSCSELFEELQVRECSEIDSCCYFSVSHQHLGYATDLASTHIFAQVELSKRRRRVQWLQLI